MAIVILFKLVESIGSDGISIIDTSQLDYLESARNKIWIGANNIAFTNDGLSEEIQSIFSVLRKILKHLEIENIFRI